MKPGTIEFKIRSFEEFCVGYDLHFFHCKENLYCIKHNGYTVYYDLNKNICSCHILNFAPEVFKGENCLDKLLEHIDFEF